MSHVEEFLTAEEEKKVIEAIQSFETETSGEIRVHIENHSDLPAFERAEEVFHILHMDETKEKNGVLFYVSVDDHEFAVIGDEGIDKVVPDDFWESVKNTVLNEFKKGNFADGLVLGIIEAGMKLKEYFPYNENYGNQLSNEISRGRDLNKNNEA